MFEDSQLFHEKRLHYVSLIFGDINAPLHFLAICMDFPGV